MSPPTTKDRPAGNRAAEVESEAQGRQHQYAAEVRHGAEGAQAALDASWPLWRMAAEEYLDVLATTGREFSADDLVEEVGTPPVTGSPNAIGGLFIAAIRRGLIVPVGYRRSTRKSRHGGVQRVYRGAEGTDA